MKTKWIGDRKRTGFLLVDADNEAEVLGSVHKAWNTWHARGGDERTGKFVPLGSWTEEGGGVVGAKQDVEKYVRKEVEAATTPRSSDMTVKKLAMQVADDACKQINARADYLRRSGSQEKYLTQELLEEVIKILQERV